MEISKLVALLEEASDAYYNGEAPILTDDAFDSLKEELAQRDPTNPFLTKVGAPVKENTVKLPVFMPSLDKVKPGNRSFAVYAQKSNINSKGWVLSDKLDGISALWIPSQKRLLLRGNGEIGQDVSIVVPLGLQGLMVPKENCMVRGELVMKKADVPEKTIGRSWVNGQLHQKTPARENISKIRFVAYELFSDTPMTRAKQFGWLTEQGFEVPWYKIALQIDETILSKALTERRESGVYEIDGIVLGQNTIPTPSTTLKNPSDMVAFKMVMEDQCADTKLVAIHWNVSNQRYLIPRLEIEPVRIGGAVIQYLTGHNARFLIDKKLAVGARIRIRRSGDVIPCLDSVLLESSTPVLKCFPEEGTWEWVGDANIQTKVQNSTELSESRLEHFVNTLEIDGMGPGSVKKLVLHGCSTPQRLCTTPESTFQEILGKKSGSTAYKQIQKRLTNLSEMTLMIASSCMPRGIGEKKLAPLFQAEPDPRKWSTYFSTPRDIPGWSTEALLNFANTYKSYETWRTHFTVVPYPLLAQAAAVVASAPPPVDIKGTYCCTGFRDSTLERRAAEKGWLSSGTLTKKTTVLVILDTLSAEAVDGTKAEKARESGIPILQKSEFIKKYLS